jgi:hypothetical protein
MPDSRGHGVSGGAIATYGVYEADDVIRWAQYLRQARHEERLYGLGVSLGAGILLQSLPGEPGFHAVAADSPFASFQEIASDRLSELTHLDRRLFWPMVESGFLYARVRYGLDLRRASSARAIEMSQIPVLLIHGTADEKTPLRHSLELHAIRPQTSRLWEVPGARHTKAISVEPEAYPRTIVQWFRTH